MPEEYVELRRDFITELSRMPGDVLKVYLYLVDRQKMQKTIKIGLSLPELARQTNVGTETATYALWWLAEQQFIDMQPKGQNHTILLHQYYPGDDSTPIPFTYKNTDETKLKKAEDEIRRMQLEYTRTQLKRESGVANACKGEERDLVAEIERDLGRGITTVEAYFLGKTLAAFDVPRAKDVWRKHAATAKNPLQTLSAMMWNKVRGNPAKPREQKEEFVRKL